MLDEDAGSRVEPRSANDRIRGAFGVGLVCAAVGAGLAGGFWAESWLITVIGLAVVAAACIPITVAVIAWGVQLGMNASREENAGHP